MHEDDFVFRKRLLMEQYNNIYKQIWCIIFKMLISGNNSLEYQSIDKTLLGC